MTSRDRVGRGRVTRRELLGSAGVALPLAAALTASGASAQTAGRLSVPRIEVGLPSFSLAERDRRWAEVRRGMEAPTWDLDAIISCHSDQWGSNARYLTQVALTRYSGGGPQVIFARDPEKKIWVQMGGARHRDEWIGRLNDGGRWLADGRMELLAESGAEAMVRRLKAEGFDRRGTRIGVAKLTGTRFDTEGLVSATWLDSLRAALPGVEFLSIDRAGPDAGPIEAAAMVKSSEEQAMIRRAVAANQTGLAAMVAAARERGARQADLWWAAFTAMYAATGEDFVRLSIGLDEGGNGTLGEPVPDPVVPGQFCTQEISAAYQGYGSQINHTFFIGSAATAGYDYYQAASDILREIHTRTMAIVKPGQTRYGELLAMLEALRREFGADSGGVVIHSGGIGFARPRLGSGADEDIVLQPGHSFDYKPSITLGPAHVRDAREQNRDLQLGESYVVTRTGVERYGDRPLSALVTEA